MRRQQHLDKFRNNALFTKWNDHNPNLAVLAKLDWQGRNSTLSLFLGMADTILIADRNDYRLVEERKRGSSAVQK
jgi:hypothetical protein